MAETDLVTLAQAKKHLNIPEDVTAHDDELADFIPAVTEVIEHVVGPVVPREVTEVHDGGREALVLRCRPVLSVVSVTEAGSEVDPSGYTPSLAAGVLYRVSGQWAGGRSAVTVVVQAGRVAKPPSIMLAAKELLAFCWRPQQGGNNSVFDAGGDGSDEAQMILGFLVPNRVLQMLAPHELTDGFA